MCYTNNDRSVTGVTYSSTFIATCRPIAGRWVKKCGKRPIFVEKIVKKDGANVAALRNASHIAKNIILAYATGIWATFKWKTDDDRRSHGLQRFAETIAPHCTFLNKCIIPVGVVSFNR